MIPSGEQMWCEPSQMEVAPQSQLHKKNRHSVQLIDHVHELNLMVQLQLNKS